MNWSYWEIGWPWLCLGGGLVLFAVLFATNAGRSDPGISRWRDPVWLAWLVVPMLMVHMFEEYGLDLLGRMYVFPIGMCEMLGYPPYPDCPIPRVHYPLINLGVAWVGAPIAALMARRNLIIGLSWYGLLLFNGLVHLGGTIVGGLESGSGVLTGSLFFILGFFWMVYVVLKSEALSKKALALSVFAGILAHLMLMAALGLHRAGVYGATGVLALDILVIFTPILIGLAGRPLLGPRSEKPA